MSEPMEEVEVEVDPPEETHDIHFWLDMVTTKTLEIEQQNAEVTRKNEEVTRMNAEVTRMNAEVTRKNAEVTMTIEEIGANTSIIRTGLERIADLVREQEQAMAHLQQEQDVSEASLDTSFNLDKLTPKAKKLIAELDHPLNPDAFTDLLKKCFGKPQPDVLPHIREFSHDVQGICNQLQALRLNLKTEHREYMSTRRKDVNLERRIERLIANIERELRRDGGRQTSMRDYVVRNP